MKIKNFIKKHENEIKVVTIITAVGVGAVLGAKISSRVSGKKLNCDTIDAINEYVPTNLDKQGAIDFIQNSNDTIKYAIFKESELFQIVEL